MKIKIDMFYASVELVNSRKKFEKIVSKRGLKVNLSEYTQLDGMCIEDPSEYEGSIGNIIVFVDDRLNNDKVEIIKCLVHELSHAVTYIMNAREIVCDETRSYMLDHLTGECYKYLVEKGVL